MIKFNQDRMDIIKQNYENWWLKKTRRPLIKAVSKNGKIYNGNIPLLMQNCSHNLSLSACDIIDRLDFELSSLDFHGDAFPYVSFDSFGPGIIAAFVGGEFKNDTGNVWFEFTKHEELKDLHIEFNPKNKWFNRIKDIYYAGMQKWGGNVLLGMVDLGGAFDILSSIRGTENLLYDLYDCPKEVIRVVDEIQQLWYKVFEEYSSILNQDGFTDWTGIYSASKYHVIQCDFSYMISEKMFQDIIYNNIKEQSNYLSRSTYHLDGAGSLKHLDSILSLDSIQTIQWVPGINSPPASEWIELYKHIKDRNKNIHLIGDLNDLRSIIHHIGGDGIFYDLTPLPMNEYLNQTIQKDSNEYSKKRF